MPVAPTSPRASDGPAPRHALRDVPYMGVIFVVAEAMKLGFQNGHPDWCNLGQGQPEVGDMDGAPPRIQSVDFQPGDHAYGPITGTDELRTAVAAHYNRLYRQGKRSQYGPQNVAIAQGGRLALSRALVALGRVTVGYKLPDYTAYEDMLDLHLSRITPVALPGKEEDGFAFTPQLFEEALAEHDLGALLISNPCNPTGQVLAGDALQKLLETAHEGHCTLLLDEFYSHFIYAQGSDGSWGPGAGPVSAAAYIDDIEENSVLLFDGLTKNHRYPGWRIGWAIGPTEMVETMSRVGSALDGGPSCIAQRAALLALKPEVADQETHAVRQVFSVKRNLLVERLSAMGVRFPAEPSSTFYAWGSLEDLPGELSDAMTFFRRALERKVLTVPGEFFDVNPGKQRAGPSPYKQWMRFSFGPPMDNLQLGLERLEALVRDAG